MSTEQFNTLGEFLTFFLQNGELQGVSRELSPDLFSPAMNHANRVFYEDSWITDIPVGHPNFREYLDRLVGFFYQNFGFVENHKDTEPYTRFFERNKKHFLFLMEYSKEGSFLRVTFVE